MPNFDRMLIEKREQIKVCKTLMDDIDNLPIRQKELLIFRFYEGLSLKKIVERTGLTREAVNNKIHEGITRLNLSTNKQASC